MGTLEGFSEVVIFWTSPPKTHCAKSYAPPHSSSSWLHHLIIYIKRVHDECADILENWSNLLENARHWNASRHRENTSLCRYFAVFFVDCRRFLMISLSGLRSHANILIKSQISWGSLGHSWSFALASSTDAGKKRKKYLSVSLHFRWSAGLHQDAQAQSGHRLPMSPPGPTVQASTRSSFGNGSWYSNIIVLYTHTHRYTYLRIHTYNIRYNYLRIYARRFSAYCFTYDESIECI